MPGEYLWYRRDFELPEGFNIGRVLLHFGAVDQCARVWVNGMDACVHTGGYLPFSADITELLEPGVNTLVVRVTDETDAGYHTRGKQKLKPGGIWYTPCQRHLADRLVRERAWRTTSPLSSSLRIWRTAQLKSPAAARALYTQR